MSLTLSDEERGLMAGSRGAAIAMAKGIAHRRHLVQRGIVTTVSIQT